MMTLNRSRGIAIVLLTGLGIGGTFRVSGDQSRATPSPALVRGNVPGEWRYWGADAWSTPLLAARSDQRRQLQLAEGRLAVERRRVRQRRVLPHHAALRQRPAVHSRDDAPRRGRARSRERRDAVDVAARRRHPLAEGAAPVRRARTRVLDRRHERARHRGHAGLPPGVARREDRRCPIRSSARTAWSI